jgi:hypothetical protein
MKHNLHLFSALTSVVVSLMLLAPSLAHAEQKCLNTAWTAFNARHFAEAIAAADTCIDSFGPDAENMQASLLAKGEPAPPTGQVPSAQDRKAIFDRWAVNDVATAYHVKGRAAESLYRAGNSRYKAIAEEAYRGAIRLSYGRTWDPEGKGSFWSPKEASDVRLPALLMSR